MLEGTFLGLDASLVLALLIFVAAVLYSSVGHGGASAYIAAMALFSVAPAVMKPTALALNVVVALIASIKYRRAEAFSWTLFWPLAAVSVPCAFLGGLVTPPAYLYKPLVGAVLLYAAWQSFHTATHADARDVRPPPHWVLMLVGGALGFLSGLIGVGGGIFLSPLLILSGWARVRVVSGVAAAFILVNSLAALAGIVLSHVALPSLLPLWAVAAALGGLIGAEFGARRIAGPTIQRLLAIVLAIAGAKLILAG